MDALAAIECGRFKDPDVLSDEVAHRHDEAARARRELLHTQAAVRAGADVLVTLLLPLLGDQRGH